MRECVWWWEVVLLGSAPDLAMCAPVTNRAVVLLLQGQSGADLRSLVTVAASPTPIRSVSSPALSMAVARTTRTVSMAVIPRGDDDDGVRAVFVLMHCSRSCCRAHTLPPCKHDLDCCLLVGAYSRMCSLRWTTWGP